MFDNSTLLVLPHHKNEYLLVLSRAILDIVQWRSDSCQCSQSSVVDSLSLANSWVQPLQIAIHSIDTLGRQCPMHSSTNRDNSSSIVLLLREIEHLPPSYRTI